ncbi:MAG: LuxR C-terminal-related transcriptional regulator [Opitutaceae bacterium]|nr:LuxR C-terminal-related transcriptional regulator [Opitutaceae bacterium]
MEFHLPHRDSVVILKGDKLYAQTLRQLTLRLLPGSNVRIATSVARASTLVRTRRADLLVAGTESSINGNVVDFLAVCSKPPAPARRILVLTTHGETRLLAALRSLPIDGLFDAANDNPDNFGVALRAVAAGGHYWSPTLKRRMERNAASLFRLLTILEQVVLSVVGDGSDDVTAAHELGLSPVTVSTVRRHLHRKLGVQHRGELVRVAAQNGFVRFTPTGVVRPGFGMLAAIYRSRRRKAGACTV